MLPPHGVWVFEANTNQSNTSVSVHQVTPHVGIIHAYTNDSIEPILLYQLKRLSVAHILIRRFRNDNNDCVMLEKY